ncbi:cell division protein SepF [Jatrophihabitans fulvus]
MYLGLVEDDEYADDEYASERTARRDDYGDTRYARDAREPRDDGYTREPRELRESREVREYAREHGLHSARDTDFGDAEIGYVEEVARPATYQITALHPRTYNEARTIGEQFRKNTPVIMNLSEMDDADAKRLVDFAAGLTFGLHGRIERVTAKVFLLSPHNVTVTAQDKQKIESGFFNQS